MKKIQAQKMALSYRPIWATFRTALTPSAHGTFRFSAETRDDLRWDLLLTLLAALLTTFDTAPAIYPILTGLPRKLTPMPALLQAHIWAALRGGR